MENILEKAKLTNILSKNEIITLLNSDGTLLFKYADEVRKKYKGNLVHLRGLIEFTNVCRQNCYYCGLRRDNKKIERYRLTEDEILACAEEGVNLGYKTIVLQGGEDTFFDTDKLCEIIKKIKKYDVALTLSIGEKSFDEYKAYRKAGADRYLMRIETTDKELYKKLHPNMDFDNRVKCLYDLKKLGYETGTGCLAGLPGQNIESLADDILFFKELNADMVGIGPFIPHKETPLKDSPKDKNFITALKVMAITRLILPDINIPATTAMETLNPKGRIIALNSGANVVMPNLTDINYRPKYELYPGKICLSDNAINCRKCIEQKINSIGRKIASSKGFRDEK